VSDCRYRRDNVPVDQIADEDTTSKTAKNGKWESSCWDTQADTANEDHSLQTFTQHGNEGKQEH